MSEEIKRESAVLRGFVDGLRAFDPKVVEMLTPLPENRHFGKEVEIIPKVSRVADWEIAYRLLDEVRTWAADTLDLHGVGEQGGELRRLAPLATHSHLPSDPPLLQARHERTVKALSAAKKLLDELPHELIPSARIAFFCATSHAQFEDETLSTIGQKAAAALKDLADFHPESAARQVVIAQGRELLVSTLINWRV